MKWLFGFLFLLSVTVLSPLRTEADESAAAKPANTAPGVKTITNGSKVKFDYTLTVDGKVLEDSQKTGPLD